MSLENSVRFRAGSAADAELLSQMHQACFPNYWNRDAFTDFFSVKGTQVMIAESLPSVECLVLSESDRPSAMPVGMLVWRLLPDEAEIITLAVLPQWRRQGLARQMLLLAMEKAHANGAKQMFLDVEAGNATAISLYESQGFSQIRRRKQYYRQQDGSFTDALVMRRKLR